MASFRTTGTRNKNRRKNSQRQWFRRLLSLLLLFCFGLFTVVYSVPAPAQVVNPYNIRFQTNANGDIRFVSNTILSCSPSASGCSAARTSTGQNNSFSMTYVDVDTDSTTFNSSSADLNLPSGSKILFAGLYWGGTIINSNRNKVLLQTPKSGYKQITATTVYDGSSMNSGTEYQESYQGFANVTADVQAGGNGTYTLANVQTTSGQVNRWGGWSLVVAYSNPSEDPRNLTVFDGYSNVYTGNSQVTFDISGFITPPFGTVKAKLGAIVYDGDRGFTGDNLNFRSPPTAATGTNIINAANPINDVFNSSISYLGSDVTTKNPNYINQLGYDADIFDASGIIRNGDTSARIIVNTVNPGGESYIPGVITSAINLYKPTVATNKIYSDINGGNVEVGDVLEYTLTITNNRDTDGNGDPANNNVLIDPIPANTTYLSNSIQITDGPNLGAKTDAQDADQAEFDAVNNRVVFRLGAGAGGYSAGNYPYVDYTPASPNTNGGILSVNTNSSGSATVGSTTTVKFRVTVNSGTATGTKITNQATEFNTGQTLGQGVALAAASPTVTASVANNPNVLLVKRITAVNQVNYTDLVDGVNDTNSPNYVAAPRDADDNNSNWSTGYLQGRINGGKVRPGDELEYTIYFLSAGKATAPTVLMCDRVPDNTTFISTAFNSSPAQATGGISGADRSIVLSYNGSTVSLTSAQDGDAGQYFPAGVDPKTVYPKIDCGGANTNGAVVVNLGNLPNATGSGTPIGSYGYIRFRSRMK